MLLALHLLGGTLEAIKVTPVFHAVIAGTAGGYLNLSARGCSPDTHLPLQRGDYFADRLPGRYGRDDPATALVLVLGANIGGALPPVLNAGYAAARRLPIGNLMVRLSGCALMLLLLPVLTDVALRTSLNTPQLVVWFHTAFSALLALLFIGFTAPMARFLERLLPEEERVGDWVCQCIWTMPAWKWPILACLTRFVNPSSR
nr:Na/Pi-cotransporter [Raoultella sp. NCTC 9187]